MHVKKNNKNACTVSWLCYSPYMTDLHDFITIRPEELIDSLADGPRAGQFNPSPEEVQELLAQVHAEEHPTQHSTDDDERVEPPAKRLPVINPSSGLPVGWRFHAGDWREYEEHGN
jgi:hypothetical protein